MKSKVFARVLCVVLCAAIIGSVLMIAIPMLRGGAVTYSPVKGGSGTITEDYVNLRSGAGTGYSIVTTMRLNTKVTFEDAALYNSSWYKIKEHATSKSGYVHKDYVAADAPKVSKIKLCAANAFTYVGCQYAFWQTGAVNPAWKSSNTSVATIDANGIVTAKAAGTAIITATEGSDSASCTLTVKKGNSTGISAANATVERGKTTTLTAKTSGVGWYSSNTNVATVKNGVVTGVATGYATISAYTSNGASTCLVKVTDPPQSSVIKISAVKAYTYVGCQYALGQTGAKNPSWTSTNTSVATVDGNGVVTAKAAGTAVINVTENGETSYCKLTVMSGSATGISEKALTLINGTSAKLSATTSGVKWYSSRSDIATVSGGIVTAKATGYVTVSAYTSSGASTCLIHVVSGAQTSDIKLCTKSATTYVGCQYAFWQTGAGSPAWKSSNPNVATVEANGILTAKAAGAVTLTVTEGGKVSSCKVTVLNGTATGISPASYTLEKGKTVTLTAKTSGVKWFSSNTQVAAVSGGKVTGKATGYATISAYTSNGASTCLIQVIEPKQDDPSTEISGYINTDDVNLRSGAGTSYSVVTTMSNNTSFTFISETLYNGDWYHIKLSDGTTGYVFSSYATKIQPPTITLNTTSATTYIGCQYAFAQTGADYPTWTSSNTSVATIDQNGILTAKAAGTATITASENGGKATAKVTVKTGSSTGISPTTLTLAAGKTSKLTAKTSGVGWFSSNKSVATVSGGNVTARGVGYATISAYTSTGASTCLVKVTAGDGTIKLSTSGATTYVGCQYAIGMTGSASASWSSSNTSVATVNSNGVVTAKGSGTATIKASNSVSSASCVITVYNGSGPGISLSSANIAAGKSILLYSDNSYAGWFSSNTSIATVKNGIVDTKGTGYVTISAYTSYGASTCLLHVTSPDNIRFVYASPNSAPKNSTVTFKAITDKSRTAVRFVVSNGSTSYTVNATSKVSDGSNYIWSGSHALGISGTWKVKAYSKTASTDYATTSGNGEGEVFVTNSTNTTTTVLGERRASDQVISLISFFEGFLTDLTDDYITGDPTIGYGKVVWENEQFYNHLTKNEAYAYLCQTVNDGPYTTVTNDFLTSNNVKFNQNQFDALVCFAYNIGPYAMTTDDIFRSCLLGASSSGSPKAGGAGYVNDSGVNLRSGAGTSYAILTTMSQNTSFTFVDAKLYNSSWYKIKLSNGTTGYIHKDYASVKGSGSDLANIDKNTFATRVMQYHHAAGACYWGLLTRRVDEVEMFFYGDYEGDGEYNKYGFYFRCANNSSFGIG